MVMKRHEGQSIERPLLFSGPMVRATLNEIKTQTRRIAKPQPVRIEVHQIADGVTGVIWEDAKKLTNCGGGRDVLQAMMNERCPYGRPGDRLWVRETFEFGFYADTGDPVIFYPADGSTLYLDWPSYSDRVRVAKLGTHVSIHMPRWASRILLEVVSVRIERLQPLSEADAIAEGVHAVDGCFYIDAGPPFYTEALSAYSELWDRLNASRGLGWATNPWVWVIEYRVISKTDIFARSGDASADCAAEDKQL